jgi:hypothetical protein
MADAWALTVPGIEHGMLGLNVKLQRRQLSDTT